MKLLEIKSPVSVDIARVCVYALLARAFAALGFSLWDARSVSRQGCAIEVAFVIVGIWSLWFVRRSKYRLEMDTQSVKVSFPILGTELVIPLSEILSVERYLTLKLVTVAHGKFLVRSPFDVVENHLPKLTADEAKARYLPETPVPWLEVQHQLEIFFAKRQLRTAVT